MAKIYHKNCEVDFTESIDAIRDQFNAASTLFDELKGAASFIYELGVKLGLSNEQIEALKEKIDSLFISLNESIFQASNKIINEISMNVDAVKDVNASVSRTRNSLNSSVTISNEEVFMKYNAALSKNVELEARITELANGFNALQNKNSQLESQVTRLQEANQELEAKLQAATDELAEQGKENHMELPAHPQSPIFLHNSSMRASTAHDEFKAKTADDFIETFEKVFKNSDEVIQLLKHINPEKDTQPIYLVQALDKARLLRQILNEVLLVFRRARINPMVLSADVSSQVAEELKRIYKTLKTVKINNEKRPADE